MPNVLNASFIRHGPVQGLEKVTIHQQINKHTLAFLDYRFSQASRYVMPVENTPFVANWGLSPLGVRKFYGYVNHYETLSDLEENSVTTQLIGLGTSRVFNSLTPRNWVGFTRSGVAREFAKKHRLRSLVHAHPDVMENWASGDLTDFRAVNTLADECGYYAWIDGGTLYFLDPKRVLASAESLDIPRFTRTQIKKSTVTAGTNAPRESGNVRRRVVHGLDNVTNAFITATSGSLLYPTETLSVPVDSYSQATLAADTMGSRDDEYFTLEAAVDGNASVTPGSLVLMAKDDVANDRVGYWLVSSVKHEITSKTFTTKIVASRTSDGTPKLSASSVLLNVRERTAAVVRDGKQWEAEVQEHVNV